MSAPIIRQPGELHALTGEWLAAGQVIGVVPTMGALHDGHLGLVRMARESCDRVIVTIFVNPRQFNNAEDLARYPRTEQADAALLAPLGVDAVFVPDGSLIYPSDHATTVSVARITDELEGAHRPGHFDGMATVVTLLLNLTRPHRAYFGEKDWQQLQVVRQMVRDLHMPVEIVACPTTRAPDGLALSSRNQRLAAADRERATLLPRTLFDTARRIEAGEDAAPVLAQARDALAGSGFGPVDYLELRDARTLAQPQPGQPARLLVAAWLGGVRLIDNIAVTLPR